MAEIRSWLTDASLNLEQDDAFDVNEPKVIERWLKTKRSSRVTGSGAIWRNPGLPQKVPGCPDVHEMIHFRERGHRERFTQLMNHFMPDWRARRDALNESPLAHEEWRQ